MRKILYFISEDWFFVSHFLPTARAAKEAGLEVTVATRVRDHGPRILAEGFRLVPIDIGRGSQGVIALLRAVVLAYRTVRHENPDIVHCIALRAVVLGGIASKFAGARAMILAPTGLGHVWSSAGPGAALSRSIIRMCVGKLLAGGRTRYVFENAEDPGEFGMSAADANVTIVPGAGVDPLEFSATPEPPSPPVKVAVVGRMLRAKGIEDAVNAVRTARQRGVAVELNIFGAPDPENPSPIPETSLVDWSRDPGISWHGATDRVAQVWREHHVGLFLTSYREGVPRALVEAAACGRPVIATDAVGCREVVRDGQEGVLVPPGDVEAASKAIEKLAADGQLRVRMGAAARRRFMEGFTEDHVRQVIRRLYASTQEPTSEQRAIGAVL
jgi:glycosyltransferase involved in cell wall biosynthesis